MSEPRLDEILADLAAGRIDAAEAARRIAAAQTAPTDCGETAEPERPEAEPAWRAYAREDLGPHEVPDPEPERPEPEPAPEPEFEPEPTPAGPKGHGAQRVSVRSVGRRVRVVGDRTVASVSVSGPHVLRRTGNTVEVAAEGQPNPLQNISLLRLPRSLDDLKNIGLGAELVVRVNPALAVDAEVTGSGLATEGVPLLGRVRVTAGGASVKGVRHVGDLLVQMGSASVEGTFAEGRSRLKCESGTLTVNLAEGANVTVRGQASVGRINWPGEGVGAVDEWVVGNGSGRLDVEIVMGMAFVKDAVADDAEPGASTTPRRGAGAGGGASCVSCGQPVAGGRFCPSCGAAQPAGACAGCGKPLPAGARFCPDCGTPA